MLASARAALASSGAAEPLQWASAAALSSAPLCRGSWPAPHAAKPSACTRFSFASTSFCRTAFSSVRRAAPQQRFSSNANFFRVKSLQCEDLAISSLLLS